MRGRPVELMMKLMRRAPLANERQERVQKAIVFLQREPRRKFAQYHCIAASTRVNYSTDGWMHPLQFFTSAASGGLSGAMEALFAG